MSVRPVGPAPGEPTFDKPPYPEPLISVLTPVYNTDPEVLRACVDSVRRQSYGKWQLCLVDDHSPKPHVWPLLQELAALDPRVVIARREANGGIVAASNDCAALATGDVFALLDHDDELAPEALRRVADVFVGLPEVDYVYSDEDLITPDGVRLNPFWKPDWSPERFRTQMYTCHLSAVRSSLFHQVGGFRDGFDGSQDWDLVLRITEQARRIVHLPEVLYHWRIVPTSVLSGDDVKPYAYESARKALTEHIDRVGINGEVVELPRRGHFRVRRHLSAEPLVSIIIPTCGSTGRVWGQERVMVTEAVRSVIERSTYRNIEFVIVYDSHTPVPVLMDLAALIEGRGRLVEWTEPFNYARKNNLGAAVAGGERLLFLNDDVEVISPDWIEALLGFLEEPDVGSAGCYLLFEDGRLQHGGHVHIGGNAGHVMFGQLPESDRGRLALHLDREVAGITGACLMIRTEVFEEVGGWSIEFPNNYNDVDLSLRLRVAGYRNVVTPHVRLYHFESVTRDPTVSERELQTLRRRWAVDLARDPYYSPNYQQDCYPDPVHYP